VRLDIGRLNLTDWSEFAVGATVPGAGASPQRLQ